MAQMAPLTQVAGAARALMQSQGPQETTADAHPLSRPSTQTKPKKKIGDLPKAEVHRDTAATAPSATAAAAAIHSRPASGKPPRPKERELLTPKQGQRGARVFEGTAPPTVPYAVQFRGLFAPEKPIPLRPEAGAAESRREFGFDEELLIVRVGAVVHPVAHIQAFFAHYCGEFEEVAAQSRTLTMSGKDTVDRMNLERLRHRTPGAIRPGRDAQMTSQKLLEHRLALYDAANEADVWEEKARLFRAESGRKLGEARAAVGILTNGIPAHTWDFIFPTPDTAANVKVSLPDLVSALGALRSSLEAPATTQLLTTANAILRDARQLLDIADECLDHLRGFDSFPHLVHHCVTHYRELQALIDLLRIASSKIASEMALRELEALESACEQSAKSPGSKRAATQSEKKRSAKTPASMQAAPTSIPADAAASRASTTMGKRADPIDDDASATGAYAHAVTLDAREDRGGKYTLVVRHASVRDPDTGRLRPIVTCTPADQSLDPLWRQWAPGTFPTPESSAAYHFRKHGPTMVRPDPSVPVTIEEYTRIAWDLIHNPVARREAEPREYMRARLDEAARMDARGHRAFHVHGGGNFAIFIQRGEDPDAVQIVSAGRYAPRDE